MRVHILQHVAFEGPGHIAGWSTRHATQVGTTRFFEEGATLPDPTGDDRYAAVAPVMAAVLAHLCAPRG